MENEKDQQKKVEGARKLEMWRKGLTEVADLKGKDANGRRETVIIEEIESPEKPWKRSRVWNHEESLHLLKEDKGTTKILELWKKPRFLGSLKILNLSYCKLVRVGGFSGLPALERWSTAKKLPVHMFYEFGIFSTCLPGKMVPSWKFDQVLLEIELDVVNLFGFVVYLGYSLLESER
ncbi:hypothetical protein L1887_13764 [Cichorium endivia]|nr:hypothetical protein L1887_13764 [Cichorium endivia]